MTDAIAFVTVKTEAQMTALLLSALLELHGYIIESDFHIYTTDNNNNTHIDYIS